jgi:hypothetical protein
MGEGASFPLSGAIRFAFVIWLGSGLMLDQIKTPGWRVAGGVGNCSDAIASIGDINAVFHASCRVSNSAEHRITQQDSRQPDRFTPQPIASVM